MSSWAFFWSKMGLHEEVLEKSVSPMIFDMAQWIETSCVLHNGVFKRSGSNVISFGRQEALW